MSTFLTAIFGGACAAAGIAVIGMSRERLPTSSESSGSGGKRTDMTRRDQVQAVLDETARLLAHYRFRNWLIVFIFSVLGATTVLGLRSNQRLAASTHGALCTLRGDLANRAKQSQAFLALHPHGFFGLSASQIQASLDNQRKTVESLNSLNCP